MSQDQFFKTGNTSKKMKENKDNKTIRKTGEERNISIKHELENRYITFRERQGNNKQ